jgi:hypothetical protein
MLLIILTEVDEVNRRVTCTQSVPGVHRRKAATRLDTSGTSIPTWCKTAQETMASGGRNEHGWVCLRIVSIFPSCCRNLYHILYSPGTPASYHTLGRLPAAAFSKPMSTASALPLQTFEARVEFPPPYARSTSLATSSQLVTGAQKLVYGVWQADSQDTLFLANVSSNCTGTQKPFGREGSIFAYCLASGCRRAATPPPPNNVAMRGPRPVAVSQS